MFKSDKLACLLEEDKKTQGWIWMVATMVTDTPFVLSFMANFLASYLIHGNNPLPEHMNYNTKG